jgi:hypothetical protein
LRAQGLKELGIRLLCQSFSEKNIASGANRVKCDAWLDGVDRVVGVDGQGGSDGFVAAKEELGRF